jgi:hypothetical protein
MAKKKPNMKTTLRVIDGPHDIFPEGTIPVVTVNQIQLYCHQKFYELDEDGEEVHVKVQPSAKFIARLNDLVIELVDAATQSARDEGRLKLTEEDLPVFD